MQKSKRILVCPLDWGLGHASRMVPVIYELINSGHQVIIGADNSPLDLLRKEFPNLEYIKFPSFSISYSQGSSQVLSMLLQLPKIFSGIKKEHLLLKKIIRDYSIDIVISDNRFGLWNKEIKTIFITHQLKIKMPAGVKIMTEPFAVLNNRFISKFSECWIPDYPGEMNLSGDLSHNIKRNASCKFIGPLSRFSYVSAICPDFNIPEPLEVLIILSGPEPQREILEKLLLSQIEKEKKNVIIVQGKTQEKIITKKENITIVPYLGSAELKYLIEKAEVIICRSGYSSIMDLVSLKKSAILIPTPGQTEQDYLAKYLSEKKMFTYSSQDSLNLSELFSVYKNINPFYNSPENNLLKDALGGQ
ncbi:MAG: hypothetical protein A2275_14240 [Bacteroidetes bacterium RIFOXYA12_FULL_35_11]|nr:MAG: hypothetical protein A2X01_12355 [Bacteroidetes bacterium GWF2_35_48]OFY76471.1 MAG: hypothetical protein A2275_14240 [Bacteroidetes bacterium RIFOXYA12_FULL_35_11]OFZ01966.1 MAG: hypothetical protein A2491_19830 [Bacteroidetes bacterium RIFOXYC12_FULL_35_7]HBX51095.1 glycosyltransferase [Bacteroidales bacterium]